MIRNQDGDTYETYAAKLRAQLVRPMPREAWEREILKGPFGLCYMCGEDVAHLTRGLCDWCLPKEHKVP